jgi:hypothetical protein
MAAGIIALLAGCPSPVESPGTAGGDSPVIAAGQGVVRVSLGGVSARTLMPGDPDFTKYTLVFTPGGTQAIVPPVDVAPATGGVIEVALESGDWTLAVTGYTTHTVTVAEEYKAAYGTTTTFNLGAGGMESVTITIDPITSTMTALWIEGNKGIFKYDISYPTSDVSGTISLAKVSGPGSGTITLPNSGDLATGGRTTGLIALAPGTYDLAVILRKAVSGADENHQPLAGTYTAVHIYPGLVTEATFTFADADFVDAVYLAGTVELTVPSGMTVKEVTVAAYSNEACTTSITDGVDTIPYPLVTPGTASPIPWFLSIPLSATQGDIWLAVTVTDSNDQPFTPAPFKQDANTIPRNGKVDIVISITVS